MKSSTRSASAINPVVAENMGKKLNKIQQKDAIFYYCLVSSVKETI